MTIRKVVFPVAGLGTRFLPATKASPKEMLPIVDKPLIQYAAEEAIAAGATDLIFITGRNKRAIEDHFDKAYELENELSLKGKGLLLELVKDVVPSHVNCLFIRQAEALGLGHAVLCARPAVGNEPFAVVLADDLIDADKPALAQMTEQFERERYSLIGMQEVPAEKTGSYGIAKLASTPTRHRNLLPLAGMVEKPQPKDAPSRLAAVGRYVFTPAIFTHLESIHPGAGGELQLTDGIVSLMQEETVFASVLEGTRYDCGSKLGYLQATVALGARHPEVGPAFAHWLAQR